MSTVKVTRTNISHNTKSNSSGFASHVGSATGQTDRLVISENEVGTLLYHRDIALLYIAYVMRIWAAPIPADRWHCSLWP